MQETFNMKKNYLPMKNSSRLLFAALFIFLIVNQGWARERLLPNGKAAPSGLKQTTAGCSPSSSFEWLDINNVRARINAGGDMWWDLPGGTGS